MGPYMIKLKKDTEVICLLGKRTDLRWADVRADTQWIPFTA